MSDEEASRLADAFQAALIGGDVETLARLLAEDAVFYSDGGGKRAAALHPIHGRDAIVRFSATPTSCATSPGSPACMAHARAPDHRAIDPS